MITNIIKKLLIVTIVSGIVIAVDVEPLAAEEPIDNYEYSCCYRNSQPGWGRGRGRPGRRYNLNKIETIDGQVVSVDLYTSRRGFSQGTHLLVSTDKETIEVHVAPSWYLEDRDFTIAPQDKIRITGSRIIIDGEPAIIANQIKKGDRAITLRDTHGYPLWRGWKQ